VIDPGHGGAQPGARWREGKMVIEEKTITLAIGLHTAELLSREGAKVVLTRAEDKAIGLYERTELANGANAHFFISLHCDSKPAPELRVGHDDLLPQGRC
jgi:N-acetylmuramoyl-L-alanine amidase